MRRRTFLGALAGLAAWPWAASANPSLLRRPIPASGEGLPIIGMGTWITFNVGADARARARLQQVLRHFFAHGGTVIDSSPMYGSAEEVLGALLPKTPGSGNLFAATKVWTPGQWLGIKQMEHSQRLWGVPRWDLMQVHNLVDWETHLETLRKWKQEGRVRYIGVTTSHGRRHDELERAMNTGAFDFVQFTYNIAEREAERRLLPLAAERKIAVLINRPFDGGDLFARVRGKPLPDFAAEFDCRNWAQFFLKFAVSHPAVTCAIPATSNPAHMVQNMGAAYGRLPDAALRRRMIEAFSAVG